MAVKHNNPEHGEPGIVHKGFKGGTTGCGFNTNENPSHWKDTLEPVNCEKKGCKN